MLSTSSSVLSILFLLFASLTLASAPKNAITFCSGPRGTGTCEATTIRDDALKSSTFIDSADLNYKLGSGPQSAKLVTAGMICGLASEKETEHCAGEKVLVTSEGFVNLKGDLFQNPRCIGCFKSPDA